MNDIFPSATLNEEYEQSIQNIEALAKSEAFKQLMFPHIDDEDDSIDDDTSSFRIIRDALDAWKEYD